VASVLEHFPPTAFYAMTGMSERALAYSEEPLQHRMLVIYEACGMSGDFASYLIRSLLSEGRIRYEVVEKTKDGLRPRVIEREGPTGLITTTTAVHLHPENETRLLSIPVTDTQDQTRQILAQSGSHHCGDDDLAEWRALQEWIESAEHRVDLPFATALAAAIPPVAVRLRRDFATLLALIRAHAVLHQVNRAKTSDGRIVATLADYAAVRRLVVDLLDVAVSQTVAATTRQTVDAVEALAPTHPAGVSLAALAKSLKLDKSTVQRRVSVAVADGYLVNQETAKGKPARLVVGDPLPDQVPLLPEPAALVDRCSVATDSPGYEHPSPPLAVPELVEGGDHARY
jgi:hypothetical protein